MGLQILQPIRILSKAIYRYKLLIKKGAKRVDKTKRFVWIYLFPHLPLTRKVVGSRMGKGKGKLAGWFLELPAGVILFEFKNLRYGRSIYFCKEMSHRLFTKIRVVTSTSTLVVLPINSKYRINYNIFW